MLATELHIYHGVEGLHGFVQKIVDNNDVSTY